LAYIEPLAGVERLPNERFAFDGLLAGVERLAKDRFAEVEADGVERLPNDERLE